MSEVGWIKVLDKVTIATTGSEETEPIYVGNSEEFGVIIVVHSGTSPDVKLDYQVIASRENDVDLVGKAPKENELSWITPESGADIIKSIAAAGSKVPAE